MPLSMVTLGKYGSCRDHNTYPIRSDEVGSFPRDSRGGAVGRTCAMVPEEGTQGPSTL